MNVVRLILKDLRLQQSFPPLLLAIEVAGVFIFLLQIPAAEIPGVALGLVHGVMLIGDFLLCYRTMVAEEKNRAFLFLKTLPVSTTEITLAKFGVNFILVTANTLMLLAIYGAVHAAGWLVSGGTVGFWVVVIGLTVHGFNNAFFLALSLAFDSDRAVWIPFPVLFLVMSVILNFHKIERAFRLEPIVDLLKVHTFLFVTPLWGVYVGFVWLSSWAMGRKRIFA